MINTLKLSLKLSMTYQMNHFIYILKNTPIIKYMLPLNVYANKKLKNICLILSMIYQFIAFFFKKALYVLVFIICPFILLDKPDYSFLWLLFFLSIVGAFIHNYDLDNSEDKYYALILMRMDSNQYVLSTIIFYMLSTFIGFFVCLWFIIDIYQAIICSLMIIGIKSFVLAIKIYLYHKYNYDNIQLYCSIIGAIIFIIGCLMFYFDLYLSLSMINIISYIFIILGVLGFIYLYRFDHYLDIFKRIFRNNQDIDTDQINEKTYLDKIENNQVNSSKHGFEMMHELFMKRHHKTLWRMTYIKCIICGIIAVILIALLLLVPDMRIEIKDFVENNLPLFLFILYLLNNTMDITRTMFSNCDHSLLNYTFYREPKNLLHLFGIRLKEMIKMNCTYAFIIAFTYAIVLFLCESPFYYSFIALISIMCMSIFFSIHYLTLYYLIQPFNKNKEIVKPIYSIITTLTYIFCYYMMDLSLSLIHFGITMIAFDIIYCVIACLLVYRFSDKTFRINS